MFWLSVAGVAVASSAGVFALLFSALADEKTNECVRFLNWIHTWPETLKVST